MNWQKPKEEGSSKRSFNFKQSSDPKHSNSSLPFQSTDGMHSSKRKGINLDNIETHHSFPGISSGSVSSSPFQKNQKLFKLSLDTESSHIDSSDPVGLDKIHRSSFGTQMFVKNEKISVKPVEKTTRRNSASRDRKSSSSSFNMLSHPHQKNGSQNSYSFVSEKVLNIKNTDGSGYETDISENDTKDMKSKSFLGDSYSRVLFDDKTIHEPYSVRVHPVQSSSHQDLYSKSKIYHLHSTSLKTPLELTHGQSTYIPDSLIRKRRELAARAEKLKIAEEIVEKQEEQAQLRFWQALQAQESALIEKERTLKYREVVAKKTYEEAMKILEESGSSPTCKPVTDNSSNLTLKTVNKDRALFAHNNIQSGIVPMLDEKKISSNSQVSYYSSSHKALSAEPTQSPNGKRDKSLTMLSPHTQSQYTVRINERKPKRKKLAVDFCEVKPVIEPAKILHTYSRKNRKKSQVELKISTETLSTINNSQNRSYTIQLDSNASSESDSFKEHVLLNENGSITITQVPKFNQPIRSHSNIPDLYFWSPRKSPKSNSLCSVSAVKTCPSRIDADSSPHSSSSDMSSSFTDKVDKLTSRFDFNKFIENEKPLKDCNFYENSEGRNQNENCVTDFCSSSTHVRAFDPVSADHSDAKDNIVYSNEFKKMENSDYEHSDIKEEQQVYVRKTLNKNVTNSTESYYDTSVKKFCKSLTSQNVYCLQTGANPVEVCLKSVEDKKDNVESIECDFKGTLNFSSNRTSKEKLSEVKYSRSDICGNSNLSETNSALCHNASQFSAGAVNDNLQSEVSGATFTNEDNYNTQMLGDLHELKTLRSANSASTESLSQEQVITTNSGTTGQKLVDPAAVPSHFSNNCTELPCSEVGSDHSNVLDQSDFPGNTFDTNLLLGKPALNIKSSFSCSSDSKSINPSELITPIGNIGSENVSEEYFTEELNSSGNVNIEKLHIHGNEERSDAATEICSTGLSDCFENCNNESSYCQSAIIYSSPTQKFQNISTEFNSTPVMCSELSPSLQSDVIYDSTENVDINSNQKGSRCSDLVLPESLNKEEYIDTKTDLSKTEEYCELDASEVNSVALQITDINSPLSVPDCRNDISEIQSSSQNTFSDSSELNKKVNTLQGEEKTVFGSNKEQEYFEERDKLLPNKTSECNSAEQSENLDAEIKMTSRGGRIIKLKNWWPSDVTDSVKKAKDSTDSREICEEDHNLSLLVPSEPKRKRGRPTKSGNVKKHIVSASKEISPKQETYDWALHAFPTPLEEGNRIECGKCDEIYNSFDEFKLHAFSVHSGVVRVKGASQEFNGKTVNQILKVVLEDMKQLHCDICQNIYRSVLGYKLHRQKCEDNGSIWDSYNLKKQDSQRKSSLIGLEFDLDTSGVTTRRKRKSVKLFESEMKMSINDADIDPDTVNDEFVEESKDICSYYSDYSRDSDPLKLKNFKENLEKFGKSSCINDGCELLFDCLIKLKTHLKTCSKQSKYFKCKLCNALVAENEKISHVQVKHDNCESSYVETSSDSESSIDEPRSRKFRTVRGSTRRYKSFLCAQKMTLDFRKLNYSEHLFPHMTSKLSDWEEINEEESRSYEPKLKYSPLFQRCKNNYNSKCDDWEKLRLFDGKKLDFGSLIFVGGPIRSSSWCPIPLQDTRPLQYIALSCSSDPDQYLPVHMSFRHKGLIQIWNCGNLIDNCTPTLSLCIAHEYGVVWSLEWCPSGVYESAGENKIAEVPSLNRLGMLAVGFSDGSVRVYVIPHPHQLESKARIFKKLPDISLIYNNHHELNLQCVNVSWCPSKKHSFIAGSFTNGMVCIWDLSHTSSPFLTAKDENLIYMYPINSIPAHNGVCTTVSFFPNSDGQHIATGGSDRTIKFWDLSQPEHPLTILRKGLVTNSVWLPNWAGAFFSFDDSLALGKSSTSFRENGFNGCTSHTVTATNATVWSISGSDWLNAVAQVDEAGEVIVSLQKHLPGGETPNEKTMYKSRIPIFSIRLENLENGSTLSLQKEYQSANAAEDNEDGDEDGNSPQKKSSRNRKETTHPDVFNEQPLTYSAAAEKYGIKFMEESFENMFKFGKDITRRKKFPEVMEPGPVTIYPLMGASSVSWNNNYGTHEWIFVGTNSGLGRVIDLQLKSTKGLYSNYKCNNLD